MLLDQPSLHAFLRTSGFELKAEGLCRDDVCIPVPAAARGDLPALAEHLRMPLVSDADAGLWAVGPPSGAHALSSATAPDLELPDIDGRPFALRSLRGKKVLLLAWASW